MTNEWKGAFLRKHVVSVSHTPILPPNKESEGVEESDFGYFAVSFDEDGHSGGTYYFPATEEKLQEFRDGTLDPTEFYQW